MTLTIQDLGALGEFFGSIAVLVTLIYLAFQTRQNTMAIRAQLDSARIGAVQELLLAAATSTELQEALEEDRVGEVTINQNRRDLWWSAMLANFQRQHANQRLLPSAFPRAGELPSPGCSAVTAAWRVGGRSRSPATSPSSSSGSRSNARRRREAARPRR